MSTGLMSCVRENSPPLEMAGNDSGAFSLPSPSTQSSDNNKRRRFHPLRNLRRIFRRRTMTSTDASTSSSNIPITSTSINSNIPQSSPSSSSSSQQYNSNLLVKNPTVSIIPTTTTITTSVPAHNYLQHNQHHIINSPINLLSTSLSSNDVTTIQRNQQQHISSLSTTSLTTSTTTSVTTVARTPTGGIQVIPQFSTTSSLLSPSSAGGFSMHKQSDKIILKLINNQQQQQGSTNDFHNNMENNNKNEDQIEMTDNQRSFSEGRLVDSDFNRNSLSHSHDSVFSESATAGSLSLGLKNELFDVLRKRRNRSDASDDDLGLPCSPTTSLQDNHNITQTTNSLQSNVNNDNDITTSSLMICSDLEGEDIIADMTMSSISSSKMSSSIDGSKTSDEIDMSITGGITRLSHSAARHKMAVRPKKKGPTRHRKPIDSTNLPSTPEVNEEYMKLPLTDLKDLNDKIKSRSLPPGVNAKSINQHSSVKTIQKSKIEKGSTTVNEYTSVANISKTISEINKESHQTQTSTTSVLTTSSDKKDDDSGFFRRFLHRNSKRNQKKQQSNDELDNDTKNKNYKEVKMIEKSEKIIKDYTSTHSQRVEETRQEIRREILSEAQSGMSLMLNSFILSTSEPNENQEKYQFEQNIQQHSNMSSSYKSNKVKSGPAARQRVLPKDLTNISEPITDDSTNLDKKLSVDLITNKNTQSQRLSEEFDNCSSTSIGGIITPKNILSNDYRNSNNHHQGKNQQILKNHNAKLSNNENVVNSSSMEENLFKLHLINKENNNNNNNESYDKEHFEKREHHRIHQPKIVALSPFQQKISRSEAFQLDYACPPPVPKPRKSVEKSKSFRYYSEGQDIEIDTKLKKYDNMPSLPDLSFTRKSSIENIDSETETSLSLGFEINDNNLINVNNNNNNNEDQFPLSQGIYTKNIILTTTSKHKPNVNKNITEIEESIDKILIKTQPTVQYNIPIIQKSPSMGDSINTQVNPNIFNVPIKRNENPSNEKIENTKTAKEIIKKDFLLSNNNNKSPTFKKNINYTTECYKSNAEFTKSTDIISKSVDSICPRVEMRNNNNNNLSKTSTSITKPRRSSSISTDNVECHGGGGAGAGGVPEFMKIQLNRVLDPVRPKINIVLAKNCKTVDNNSSNDEKTNEIIEINENKPPLPPLSIDIKRNSTTMVKEELISPITKTITNNSSSDDDDSSLPIVGITEISPSPILFERRKSVTDEKLKYEKKIEELKFERKNSITEEVPRKTTDNRKISIDDDYTINNNYNNNNNNNNNGVILRKKSFGLIQTTVSAIPQIINNNKDDSTPELMKVFARRSLKIKDDELQSFDDNNIDNKNILKIFTNLDSDKENQSSSEEKLDKLPKIELTIIQQQKPILFQQHKIIDEKLRNSLIDLRKTNNTNNNLTHSSNNNNNNNNSLTSTPTKTFNRYSSNNIVNYNNKTITTSATIQANKKLSTTTPSTQNNIPIVIEQSSTTIKTTNGNNTSSKNEQNNNFLIDNNKSTSRYTISSSNPTNLEHTTVNNSEFKGILQRRAEWEKRAKEALK